MSFLKLLFILIVISVGPFRPHPKPGQNTPMLVTSPCLVWLVSWTGPMLGVHPNHYSALLVVKLCMHSVLSLSGHLSPGGRCTPLGSGVHRKVVDLMADCCGWSPGCFRKADTLEHQHGSHWELEHEISQGAESKSQQVFTRAPDGEDGLCCSLAPGCSPQGLPAHAPSRLLEDRKEAAAWNNMDSQEISQKFRAISR